jgi:hypothetical protein
MLVKFVGNSGSTLKVVNSNADDPSNFAEYRVGPDTTDAGAGCRISDLISGYSGMIGLKIANAVNLSYSYELAFNNSLVNYTGNTHEILIGFIIGNTYGDSCPRNVW